MQLRHLLLLAATGVAAAAAPASRDAALELFKAKQFPEARAAFEQLAAADPQNAEAHYYLGVIAKRRNDTDEAIRQLEQATALAPKNAEYLLDLGDAYGAAANQAGLLSRLGFARKCQAALEKAVALDPDNVMARNGLVTYYRQAPAFAGGGMSKAYEQAAEIKKRNPLMGAQVYGQLYLSEKKYDEAFRTFEDVLKTAPDNYLSLYSIGRTAAQTGQRLDRGEQTLKRCLELPPGKGEPPHAAVQWRLGNIAEKRGDVAGARAHYEAGLVDDPNFPPLKESLAKLK